MLASFFSQAALGWLGRRALDWGGWLGTVALAGIGFYNQLSPSQQAVIGQVISGNWQDITLGALAPFAVLVFSQVLSFRATTKPQIVTDEGVKVSTDDLPRNKKVLTEEIANVAAEKKKAARKPGLLDKLFGKR
jgi:hypothetical protein